MYIPYQDLRLENLPDWSSHVQINLQTSKPVAVTPMEQEPG